MVHIIKQSAPKTLIQYKNSGNTAYNDFPEKDDIRKNLVQEQNELCAYCMSKISAESAKMKIEHFKCQSCFPELQLEYSNMLGCCLGQSGKPHKQQTCDTYKGDSSLSLNPSNEIDFKKMQIVYTDDGTIKSLNETFDKELNDVLNLNTNVLKANRKTMIESEKMALSSKTGTRSKVEIQKLIQKFEAAHKPYYGAAIYYLEKKLKGAK